MDTTPAPPGVASAVMPVLLDAVRSGAAEVVAAREGGELTVDLKTSVRDIVTSADLASERAVLGRIRSAFPGHHVLSEESAPEASSRGLSGSWWIVDPIDGTTNFAYGHPSVAVSAAYAVDGVVLAGAVAAPFLGETFHAVKGGGAFLNGRPVSVSRGVGLAAALVGTGFPYARDDVPALAARAARVLSHCRDLRRVGSAALDLCWTACGRLDAYYETVMPWDMAAGALVAREAGAVVGSFSAGRGDRGPDPLPPDLRCDDLLAAPPDLWELLAGVLRGER